MAVPRATRANLPNRYAFSLVRPPPPKHPTLSGPYRAVLAARPVATTSSASSQLAGRRGLSRCPGTVRMYGWRSRSGWSSSSAAVQPFEHKPPRLVGESGSGTTAGRPAELSIEMPHWSEQYGQCVPVGGATPPSSGRRVNSRCRLGNTARTRARIPPAELYLRQYGRVLRLDLLL